ncbi:class F sortase [Streptomyces sp. AC550_RSS872]|uniref:class F sortase n=1 Tax=Streptomyces sp. AC550_RSS872 TaxID=2823689 RepID=UPI001C27E88A|nr:class F sortase [Streptomyces sp. AC550_RSS872]
MARRKRRRPWYRRRAYRLARTAVLTVLLVVGGIRLSERGEPPAGEVASAPGSPEVSGGRAGVTASDDAGTDAREEATRSGAADARPGTEARPDAVAETGRETGREAVPPAPSPSRPAPSGKARNRPAPPSPLPRSRATRLVIPYVGIDAPLIDLRLDSERRLPAPPEDEPDVAGWYADGPSPGEQGTAIAVGHLDTETGPAVFGGLGELKRGKRVEVRRADGRTAVYSVDAIKSYEKDKFPNHEVYGARKRPELRLITCGGNYDRRTGYSGNVVVFAHLTATREPRAAAEKR